MTQRGNKAVYKNANKEHPYYCRMPRHSYNGQHKQNKEDILAGQRPVEELESEAEAAERVVEYNPDNIREIIFNGNKYKVTEKQYLQIMKNIKDNVDSAVENNSLNLNDDDYLKFIIAYNNMQKNGEFVWQK